MANKDIDSRNQNLNNKNVNLSDVVYALRNNIMRTLKVATLATVISIKDQVEVQPFPLIENEAVKNIYCSSILIYNYNEKDKKYEWINLSSMLSEGDVVLVLFVDRNSNSNLALIQNNNQPTKLNENINLHTEMNGVIVGIVYKKG